MLQCITVFLGCLSRNKHFFFYSEQGSSSLKLKPSFLCMCVCVCACVRVSVHGYMLSLLCEHSSSTSSVDELRCLTMATL